MKTLILLAALYPAFDNSEAVEDETIEYVTLRLTDGSEIRANPVESLIQGREILVRLETDDGQELRTPLRNFSSSSMRKVTSIFGTRQAERDIERVRESEAGQRMSAEESARQEDEFEQVFPFDIHEHNLDILKEIVDELSINLGAAGRLSEYERMLNAIENLATVIESIAFVGIREDRAELTSTMKRLGPSERADIETVLLLGAADLKVAVRGAEVMTWSGVWLDAQLAWAMSQPDY